MFKRFLPKRDVFFPLFRDLAAKNHEGAEVIVQMLSDLEAAAKYARKISALEKKGDEVAREVFDQLHKTFVTPFDRNDIHHLAGGLDEVLDQIHRTARRLVLYQVKNTPEDIIRLGGLLIQATQALQKAVSAIETLSRSEFILQTCQVVNEIEENTDSIILTGMSHLFSVELDFKALLKMKEIYESFQAIFKSCKNTANVVRSIVLEYS